MAFFYALFVLFRPGFLRIFCAPITNNLSTDTCFRLFQAENYPYLSSFKNKPCRLSGLAYQEVRATLAGEIS
jgi:hypothetical protein